METLASMWQHERDLADLRDLDGSGNVASVWGSKCVFTPPAGQMWTQQLPTQLQRNKQLQEALLQREEELARLQEENHKLREFLGSSFVRNLQEKAEKLTADRRGKLKRNLMDFDQDPSKLRSHSKQITKRVCRDLTAQFCSESSDAPVYSEPSLDLWVLRTLGLKDQNTIDMSSEFNFMDRVYDDSVTLSVAAEHTPSSSFCSPASVSTPSSVPRYFQAATADMDYGSSEYDCSTIPADLCSGSPVNVTANKPTRLRDSSETLTSSRAETFSVQPGETSPEMLLSNWCPPPSSCTPSEQIFLSSRSSFVSVLNKYQAPSSGCSRTCQPDADSTEPRHKPTDLAFSMSLSPSSSVKTHSFPQGQAFIRKDTGGRWNFTWVPRQEP